MPRVERLGPARPGAPSPPSPPSSPSVVLSTPSELRKETLIMPATFSLSVVLQASSEPKFLA